MVSASAGVLRRKKLRESFKKMLQMQLLLPLVVGVAELKLGDFRKRPFGAF